MRIGMMLGLPLVVCLQYEVAVASGAYKCCFMDKDGARYVYQGRASSRYKGTIDELCRIVAREKKASRCSGAALVDVSYNLVKGRDDFSPDEQPDTANLYARCSGTTCAIGLTIKGTDKVSVRALNKAQCSLASFPAPKDPPGSAAYTLRITLPSGQTNACVLDINGKTSTFFNDMSVEN